MPALPLSSKTELTTLADDDLLYVVDNGTNKKLSPTNLATYTNTQAVTNGAPKLVATTQASNDASVEFTGLESCY